MAASTGSPASRKSTKLTPLTARPSLTSRQGITRTLNIRELLGRGACVADQRQCGGRIEPAVIERAACDRAGQFLGARRKQRFHVLDRGEAARRNDGYGDALGELDRRLEIEALQQAVARNVGEDDRGNPGILEPLRDLEGGDLRRLRPAFDRDLPVTGVETDRNAAGKFP